MKNKLTTLVLTAALGAFAAFSAKADGDIYDIRPCDANGIDKAEGSTWSSMSAPLGSGEKVYFKIRLVSRQIDGGSAVGRWYLDYDGLINETVADSLYPMQIGIYVSGVKTYATLETVLAEGNYTTALVFSYQTQPGDFAMPVRLATADGPAGDSISNGEYVFNDLRSYWKMSCVTATNNTTTGMMDTNIVTCSWRFCSDSARTLYAYTDLGVSPVLDYSLEQCGIYVQTVDFSDDAETESYWRTIHENSTITGGGVSPRLSISAASSDARTFYVWSDDESVAYVKTDNTVTMQIDNGGTMETYHVGKVTFQGGSADDVSFLVQAMSGAEGSTANLILSAYSNFNFSASTGDKLIDYVTVPVYVSEALPASIVAECSDTTVAADHDYLTAKTSLSIYLSQAATNDVTVTLKTTFEDDATKTNWYDYVRFSTSANTLSTLPSTNELSFTISAGSTDAKVVYVYTLRGDDHTVGDGHQVVFTPYISAEEKAAAGIESETAAGLWISAAKPVITTPDSTSTYEVTAGEELEITVAVEDTYADMTDTDTGYTVRIKTGSTASWTTLSETFKASGEDGELIGLTTGNPPTIEYPTSGEQTSQIQVISPISGKKSETVSFTVNVAAAKTTSASSLDDDPDNYTEGDVVKFRMSLSSQNDTGAPIYAFLLCNEDVDLTMFGGTAANAILTNTSVAVSNSVGRQISSVGTYVDSSFTVLDGLSSDDGGQNYTFSVVLCTTKYFDPDHRLAGYDTTEMLNITVYNAEPTFNTVYLNGFEAETDGYTFANQYPKGQDQTIQPEFKDVSYDLKHGFEYKWTAYRNNAAYANGTVSHDTDGTVTEVTTTTNGNKMATLVPDGENINEVPLVYNFPRSGTWTVKFQMKDKDMTSYSSETYSITFEVLDNPAVTITLEDTYLETDIDATFDVALGYFDSDDDIVVKLTVTPPDGVNPGTLILDSSYKTVPTGYADLADNEYYVSFDSADAISIGIDSMDGTSKSSSKGFTITAAVVSTGTSPEGTTWADYYVSDSVKLCIDNVEPVAGYVTSPNTNAWSVSGGAATSYPINWSIRSDVDGDFTNYWANGSGPGIKVSFMGCDNATTFYVTDTDEWSGTFIPNFGSVQGDQNVVLTIEDKDSGILTYTYMYTVSPSKFLRTYATGPSGGTTTSSLSQRYYKQRLKGGLGEGHTYVSGATFTSAENFELTWNCSRNNTMNVYAFGYKLADNEDNGSLDNSMDVAIDGSGAAEAGATITDYYTYEPSDGKDSYFYLWILTSLDESGNPANTILGETISPEVGGAPGIGRVALPTEETEEGGYLDTIVEAIFSKEWLAADNLGDINQDGIPDYFATAGWGDGGDSLIATTTGGETLANDLVDIASGNPDGDYLPGYWTGGTGATLVDSATSSYAPVGYEFNNRLEIRGFHDGLNETSVALSDVWFSEAETNAYKLAFAAANGTDWTEADGFDLSFWSPEPRGPVSSYRMDPTMDDTDSDGLPDGWEYFFWYQAKVWAPAGTDPGNPRAGQDYVFERFNPGNIVQGIEIPASEVLERFDPCNPLDTTVDGYNPDFDGDGLTDLEELAIGTNPCHWDTDGDHMSDGWEVMMCLDPLNGSKTGNEDGDFMACIITEGMPGRDYDADPSMKLVDLMGNINAGNSTVTLSYTQSHDADGNPNYIDNISGVITTNATDSTGADNEPHLLVSIAIVLTVDVEGDWGLLQPLLNPDGSNVTYGRAFEDEFNGDEIPDVWHWGYNMTLTNAMATLTLPAGTAFDILSGPTAYIILHDQVHSLFGFDPRTGWYRDAAGYVADRWNPSINTDLSPFDVTGAAINTEPYCDYDEYLTMKYRYELGVARGYLPPAYTDAPKYDTKNIWNTFRSYTTNPSVAYPVVEVTSNDTTTVTTNATVTTTIAELLAEAFKQAGSTKTPVVNHGADTDGDGVPDGWELYMGRNPNSAPNKDSNEGLLAPWDKDEDLLGYAAEYAGTDSCNAYKNCASIYKNHPGNSSGWFNKFFPTNPDEADTDGDGITDAGEGGVWDAVVPYGGSSYLIKVSFIYGSPADSITCCVRGGGLNPCTVDTDIDGLPDLWEVQYCGIPTDPSTPKYVPPPGAEQVEVEYQDSTWIADGIPDRTTSTNIVYIVGGLDGTWGGDAWTDTVKDGNSYDPLLGAIRDVDFDHDGLQNYQEYLVQQVRHFRWDDITTPLMARYMDEGEYDPMTMELLSDHVVNEAPAFTPMIQSVNTFLTTAIANWQDGSIIQVQTNLTGLVVTTNEFSGIVYSNTTFTVTTNIIEASGLIANKHFGEGFNYMYSTPWSTAGWRANGYMAPPIHDWDRMITCFVINPYIMMPPAGVYVSTDPRMSDTDMDGMDDYYEMFHGLNPILGSTAAGSSKDIIALSYGSRIYFNAFWNEWTHPDFNRYKALMGGPGSETPPLQDATSLDPFLYPWAMGTGEADPDGDGLRNDSEGVTANLTSPMTHHTDPTPLWFTDSTAANSYTAQYYLNAPVVSGMPFWPLIPVFEDPYSVPAPEGGGNGPAYLYAFEENEGYDTDNDWRGDAHEIIKTVRPTSDPLDFSDPLRRQALYLDGNQSFAVTRESNKRSIDAVDFYKQFTVEAWIRPEKSGSTQTIIDRCCLYGYDANTKDDAAIRSNFRIGLTADGRVFGMYDNDDAIVSGSDVSVSCMVLNGPEVPLNEWTHVAMTYDGEDLILYVNGIERSRVDTQLIPANGVTCILQDPSYTNTLFGVMYESEPSSFFIGGRPKSVAEGGSAAFDIGTIEYDSMNADEWYQGYVDEVRIWDGARTASEISANYKKHLTQSDVSANREEVYTHLMSADADSSRNNNDGLKSLTAELVQQYDFSTLPGAVDAADVAPTPIGFADSVAGQLGNAPSSFDQNVGWWNACVTKSTVYSDYTVVPWIQNAVHHLPVIDGSVVDSFLYSDYLGGYYTLASENELAKYTLNNSAMPYSHYLYYLDRYQRLFCLNQLLEGKPDDALVQDLVYRYEYEIRSSFTSTDDLVPMGGAYAKTCPEMWDGNGVADAWEITSTDTDADGLPDWWEDIYGLDPSGTHDWNNTVTWNGSELPAYVAYAADLAMGMQPDGTYNPDYASTADVDGDNIPDWWETLFGVSDYGADDDPDKDGLSNYSEYLISFGSYPYGVTNGWNFVSPINAYSTSADQVVPDYYLRTPKSFDDSGRHIYADEYYGEIFTDHDFMETWWESLFANSFANPYLYDPDKDTDGDGWDNWSEARTYAWRGAYSSDQIDRYYDSNIDHHIACYPRPALGIRVVYNGIRDVAAAGFVVRTSTGSSPRVDATFNLSEYFTTGVGVESMIGGYYGDTKIRGFLNPGSLVPGDVKFLMCRLTAERTYYWHVPGELHASWWLNSVDGLYAHWDDNDTCYLSGTYSAYRWFVRSYGSEIVVLDETELDFDDLATTASDVLGWHGDIILNAADATSSDLTIGSIDYRTGEYEIDLALVSGAGVDLEGMVFKAVYSFRFADEWPKTFWISEATSGYVRQGKNTIEAWIDLDADGVYTAGEPYGIARNVDVGWHKMTETVIELRDTSPVIPRYLLSDGTCDRGVVNGISSGVTAAQTSSSSEEEGGSGEEVSSSSGLTAKVVVRRVGINGEKTFGQKTVPVRTLLSKTYVLDDRAYITEADVLADDRFDLDWKWLVNDAVKLGLTASDIKSAEYEIDQVVSLSGGAVTNIALASFINEFSDQRPIPVVREPVSAAPVYSAAPEFSWSCSDDTMTAFRLQVSTSTNAADIVYDSGTTQLPGHEPLSAGVTGYTFTAPIYAGAPVTTNGAAIFLDGSNYYWRVIEFNAKYNTVDAKYWSAWAEFQMDVANENRYPNTKTGYGQCGAVVRYFGPNTNDLEGIVVAEVHTSADFTDQPLAQLRVDISQLDDMGDVSTVNAAFAGIDPGTVYLMAYVDSNNNGKRDDNESWGYANYIGTDEIAIFTPRGLTVTDELYLTGEPPKLVVYIEDTDVNRNEEPDCFETSATSSSSSGDSDKDGLLDEDEDGYATDAAVWDSDGDGMPDGWEVKLADFDPNFDDAAEVAAGDVMAFATNTCTIVTVQNTDGSDPVNLILKAGQAVPTVGDDADELTFYEAYDYPVVTSNGVVSCYGRGAEVTLSAADGTTNRVMAVSSGTVALVHAQVYAEYGFNSKTANPVSFNEGTAVNTKEFTALDKYLVIRYLASLGICDEEEVNVNNLWSAYSLRPYVIDADNDGVADGWELYVMFGTNEMNSVNFTNGTAISCWNFDDRFSDHDGEELSLVHEYDGGYLPTDPWNVDTDGDGVTDLNAWKYHLKGSDGVKDADGDGLSNYVEYMLSEVFQLGDFSADNAFSVNAYLSDYFFPIGQLYAGYVFTDHDRVRDQWETAYLPKSSMVSPYAYDPDLDPDGDGWCNESEFQAGTDPTKYGSLSIDGVQMDEYPVPAIELKVTYRGNQNIAEAPIVVKAWSDTTLVSIPDAVWTIGGGATVVTENGNSNTVSGIKYLGMNPQREALLHLSPGSVVPGTVKFEFKDLGWVLGNPTLDLYYLTDPSTAMWYGIIIDNQRNDGSGIGDIVAQNDKLTSLGTIDYATGEVRVDFASFPDNFAVVGDVSGQITDDGWYSYYDIPTSYVRVKWQALPISGNTVTTYYLSKADDRTASNNSLGHIREGVNTFVAFYDLNKDGMYTIGEPFGTVRDVLVGWNYAKAEVELFDAIAMTPRYNLTLGGSSSDSTSSSESTDSTSTAATDREVHGSGFVYDVPDGIAAPEETLRVRVVRFAVDSPEENMGRLISDYMAVVYDRLLDLTADGHQTLTEADILSYASNQFDLDWDSDAAEVNEKEGKKTLDEMVADMTDGLLGDLSTHISFTNMYYAVYVGNDTIMSASLTNGNILSKMIVRPFGYTRTAPTPLKVLGTINAPAPTFSWVISNDTTFTAFKVRIKNSSGTEIWNSDYQMLPASDADGVYNWTPPIRVGSVLPGGTTVFENNANYSWEVSTYNAKYKSDSYVSGGSFYVNVLTNSLDYATAKVAVRYYGPSAVASGVIRVQAFTTPDFSGEPAGEGYVTSTDDIASTAAPTNANAMILGLTAGTYYIRAFIDTENDGRISTWMDAAGRDYRWESWGCYCTRDTTTGTIYTPKSITVGSDAGASEVIPVYIDDCDSDQDTLPDAWEWVQAGNLTSLTTTSIDQNTGGFAMKSALTGAIATEGAVSSGMAVLATTTLKSSRVAALLLGVDATGSDDEVEAALNSAVSDATAEATSVVITDISLDRDSGTVSVTATTEGDVTGSAIATSQIYEFASGESTLTLTCKVLHCDTLGGDWEVIATGTVEVEYATKTYTFTLDDDVDLSSGFFKVTLE